MKIFDDYEKIYKRFINDEGLDKQRSYKISGNIFSHLIRSYVEKIVMPKYKVSSVNAYIKGCKIEWDLLIVKNPQEDETKYNIYNPENVVCALEFKTSGAIFKKAPVESKNYIEKYIRQLNKLDIKYGYISLCEIPDNLKIMQETYKTNCFWLIEGYYRDINKEDTKKNDLKEFQAFLENLINL